jgi:hypothetical protein
MYLTLGLYFGVFGYLFTYAINKLRQYQNEKEEETFNLSDYSVSNENFDKINNFLEMNNLLNKNIIVGVKNNIKSLTLLNVLNQIYINKQNINVLYVSDNLNDKNNSFFDNLCYQYEFNYINCIIEKNTDEIDYNKYFKIILNQTYEKVCLENKINNVILCVDINSLCNDILYRLFTYNLNNFSDIDKYNNFTTYKPMMYIDICDRSSEFRNRTFFSELFRVFNGIFPNWKNNLTTQMKVLLNDVNNKKTFSFSPVNTFKNGFIINLDELNKVVNQYNYYELKYIINEYCNNYNVLITEKILNGIYLNCNNNTNFNFIFDNWNMILHYNKLYFINYNRCQKFICSCKAVDMYSDNVYTYNKIKDLLDETNFNYYICQVSEDNLLNYEQVYYENDNFPSYILNKYLFNNF